MANHTLTATITIPAPAETVFEILADPTTHAAIDGTGWVRESLDGHYLTGAGQIFRIAMYHDNHPNKTYEMANTVVVFDRPRAIAWQPGQVAAEDETLSFGGWVWRYDLRGAESAEAHVTLTYDWSLWRQNSASTFNSRRSTPCTWRIRSCICPSWAARIVG